MPAKPNAPTGGVYFLQADGRPDDPIKIGWSGDDVESRLRDCQIGSHRRLQIIGVIPGVPREVEQRLHRRFAESRLSGEWFEPTDALRQLIAGQADFLFALVTAGQAAKILRIPQTSVDEKLDEIGERLGPGGGTRFWKEDVLTIADAIEEERVYRLVRHATALIRRRLSSAIQEATSPESLAECIAEAFAEPVSDRKPRLVV